MAPYSSATENAALAALTPELASVIVPETVTVSIAPVGGHRMSGVTLTTIAGGTTSSGTVLFSSTSIEAPGGGALPTTRSGRPSPLTSVASMRTEGAFVLYVTGR